MEEQIKAQEGQLSDDELSGVAGGAGVSLDDTSLQAQREGVLDSRSKSDGKIEDIQAARLDHLDTNDSSK